MSISRAFGSGDTGAGNGSMPSKYYFRATSSSGSIPYGATQLRCVPPGPFAGMEAVFAEQDGKKRVIVLLELLGKTNKVRIDRDWIAKAALRRMLLKKMAGW